MTDTTAALTATDRQTLADRILEAIDTGVGIDPPSLTMPLRFDDAYDVQHRVVAGLVACGATVRGHKIGFTSAAMRRQYEVTEPDFGRLLDTHILDTGSTLDTAGLVDPRIEPEVTFLLGHDLIGPGVTRDDVLAATDTVHPSLEVIDSRVGSERAKGVDSISDNAGYGRTVLGVGRLVDAGLDLAEVDIRMTADAEVFEGRGGEVMGHPAEAVAWLANRLADVGEHLRAGDLVMSGSVTRSVEARPGMVVRADFGPLGEVEVRVR